MTPVQTDSQPAAAAIDMIRMSDDLTMFFIDGPGAFELFGTRANIRDGLSFVKDVARLNNKAIAVLTDRRPGKQQVETLQRVVRATCDKQDEPVEFRTCRRDSPLGKELSGLLSQKLPDFKGKSLLEET